MAVVLPVLSDEAGAGDGFDRRVARATGGPLRAAPLRTVQVNIGLRCNLA